MNTSEAFAVLGLSDLSEGEEGQREVRARYRSLAKQHHPDLHPGDAAAAEQFRKIETAYRVLSAAEAAEPTARDSLSPEWAERRAEWRARRRGLRAPVEGQSLSSWASDAIIEALDDLGIELIGTARGQLQRRVDELCEVVIREHAGLAVAQELFTRLVDEVLDQADGAFEASNLAEA